MSISRRTDRENHLWADLPEPASLTPAISRQIVSAVVAGDPNRADELANLLLTLERELANCDDPRVDGVLADYDAAENALNRRYATGRRGRRAPPGLKRPGYAQRRRYATYTRR